MAKMKELDRIAKVVAEDMLEQMYENIHWSMPESSGEGDEYMKTHDHIMSRAIYYMNEKTKQPDIKK